MATIDAVMADKRAADVLDKYRPRLANVTGEGDLDEMAAIQTELRSDIANAINAAVAEVMAAQPVETVAERDSRVAGEKAEREADAERRSRSTTHMPSSGHDKPALPGGRGR